MRNREKWQKEYYPKFWSDQVNKYGFDDYCKGLLNLILSKNPTRVYELAIGTGWPFAINLHEQGISVSGSDISDLLIEQLKLNYPEINARVESYENIESTPSEVYDLVYCLRSTWYFPNIFDALDTMFKLTKENGYVIFDIMNLDSDYIQNIIRRHRALFAYNMFKNAVKSILSLITNKNYLIQDIWNIHELPVSSETIERYLQDQKIMYKRYSINQIIDGLDTEFTASGIFNSKIVFVCEVK